jgi:hypothetical protein
MRAHGPKTKSFVVIIGSIFGVRRHRALGILCRRTFLQASRRSRPSEWWGHYSVRRNSGRQNLTDRAVDFVRQNFAERKVSRMVRFTPVLLSGSAYFGDS